MWGHTQQPHGQRCAVSGPGNWRCESGQEEHASEDVEGVVDEIWLHVEGTSIADADKAVDIRSALENRLGKQEAKRLLACTRATVAKQNGHKNRIMRIGRIALRLRRDSPSLL